MEKGSGVASVADQGNVTACPTSLKQIVARPEVFPGFGRIHAKMS